MQVGGEEMRREILIILLFTVLCLMNTNTAHAKLPIKSLRLKVATQKTPNNNSENLLISITTSEPVSSAKLFVKAPNKVDTSIKSMPFDVRLKSVKQISIKVSSTNPGIHKLNIGVIGKNNQGSTVGDSAIRFVRVDKASQKLSIYTGSELVKLSPKEALAGIAIPLKSSARTNLKRRAPLVAPSKVVNKSFRIDNTKDKLMVAGNVQFLDRGRPFKGQIERSPFVNASVEIWENADLKGNGKLVSSGITNANGDFRIIYNRKNSPKDASFLVKILAENSRIKVRYKASNGTTQPWAWYIGPFRNVTDGTALDLGPILITDDRQLTGLPIMAAIVFQDVYKGWSFLTATGRAPGVVNIKFPGDQTENYGQNMISVSPDDWTSRDAILHEYGASLMKMGNRNFHPLLQTLSKNMGNDLSKKLVRVEKSSDFLPLAISKDDKYFLPSVSTESGWVCTSRSLEQLTKPIASPMTSNQSTQVASNSKPIWVKPKPTVNRDNIKGGGSVPSWARNKKPNNTIGKTQIERVRKPIWVIGKGKVRPTPTPTPTINVGQSTLSSKGFIQARVTKYSRGNRPAFYSVSSKSISSRDQDQLNSIITKGNLLIPGSEPLNKFSDYYRVVLSKDGRKSTFEFNESTKNVYKRALAQFVTSKNQAYQGARNPASFCGTTYSNPSSVRPSRSIQKSVKVKMTELDRGRMLKSLTLSSTELPRGEAEQLTNLIYGVLKSRDSSNAQRTRSFRTYQFDIYMDREKHSRSFATKPPAVSNLINYMYRNRATARTPARTPATSIFGIPPKTNTSKGQSSIKRKPTPTIFGRPYSKPTTLRNTKPNQTNKIFQKGLQSIFGQPTRSK